MPPFVGYPSPRVSQLDAYILDNELFSLLKQQLSDTFQLLQNQRWSFNQHPELWTLVLKLVIFRLTTYKTGSSYGLKLQNLKLSDSKSGKLIDFSTRYLLLATIIGDYIFKKFQSYLYLIEDSTGRQTNKLHEFFARHKTTILKKLNDLIKVLELLNFVLFLVHGKYPSVVHRILGISLTPIVADLLKFNGDNVNFEFQNRQLVWNVMTEFLVFILPLLQLQKWKRAFRQLLPTRAGKQSSFIGPTDVPVSTRFTDLPQSHCAICIELTEKSGMKAVNTFVTNPCITNCGHIFCYVCLATRFNAIENGSEEAEGCPRCRLKLTSFKQYGQDEDEIDKDAIMVEYKEIESDDEPESVQPSEKEVIKESQDSSDLSSEDDGGYVSLDDDEGGYGSFDENEDLEEEVDEWLEGSGEDMDDDFDEFYD